MLDNRDHHHPPEWNDGMEWLSAWLITLWACKGTPHAAVSRRDRRKEDSTQALPSGLAWRRTSEVCPSATVFALPIAKIQHSAPDRTSSKFFPPISTSSTPDQACRNLSTRLWPAPAISAPDRAGLPRHKRHPLEPLPWP